MGGSYSWSKEVGFGTLTFVPSASVEDPEVSNDTRAVYKAKVEYTVGGVTVSDNTSNIYAVQVELFRDSDENKPLKDWPAETGKPRSPKYLFREDDAIYVRVEYYAPYSDTTEHYDDAVCVTSATAGLWLDVWELSDNTRDCYNKYANKELLYLSDSTVDSPTEDDKIEVVDEEVLTFYLEVPPQSGNYVESNWVMVDRAEVAAVDGTPTLDAAEFHGDMEADDWFSAGLYDKDHDKALGDDNKCVELGNKADFMYVAGHCWRSDSPTKIYGMSGYGLDTRDEDDNLQVADVGTGTWASELDWLILACCSTCYISHTTPRMGPGKEWVDTMDDGGLTHGVMGYEWGAPGETTPTTDVQLAAEFVSALAGKTVKDAWIDTNFAHKWATANHVDSPLHAVAIFRDDNVSDKLSSISTQTVTQDSTDDNFTYYYIYWEPQTEDPYVKVSSVEKRSFGYTP